MLINKSMIRNFPDHAYVFALSALSLDILACLPLIICVHSCAEEERVGYINIFL